MKKVIAFLMIFILVCSPICVLASENTTITVDTAKVSNSDDITFVDINISGNSGISAMTISITYDASALQYTEFKEGIFSDYSVKDYRDKNYIRLVILENEDITEDGLLISLGFKLKDAEKGRLYPVSIEYSEGDFCNSKGEAVSPKIVSGGVAYLNTGIAEQTSSKYEGSSSVSGSSSQSGDSSLPSSSAISSSSQVKEEVEKIETDTQSEVASSQGNEQPKKNNLKWIIIPIALILIALVIYVIARKKK